MHKLPEINPDLPTIIYFGLHVTRMENILNRFPQNYIQCGAIDDFYQITTQLPSGTRTVLIVDNIQQASGTDRLKPEFKGFEEETPLKRGQWVLDNLQTHFPELATQRPIIYSLEYQDSLRKESPTTPFEGASRGYSTHQPSLIRLVTELAEDLDIDISNGKDCGYSSGAWLNIGV